MKMERIKTEHKFNQHLSDAIITHCDLELWRFSIWIKSDHPTYNYIILYVCVLAGLEMGLRVVQVEERRPAPWGKSLETWRRQSDLWMNWSTPAPHSSNSSLNIKTVRDILYMQLCVYLHSFLIVLCVWLSVFLQISASVLLLLPLDPALYVRLRDIPRHPIHRQSPRPDSHCYQGPCWDQAGGARHSRGESTTCFLCPPPVR